MNISQAESWLFANDFPGQRLPLNGPAVYQARALYHLIYSIDFNIEDEGCQEEGYSMRSNIADDPAREYEIDQLRAHEKHQKRRFERAAFKIYPNPSSGIIYLKTNLLGPFQIRICNSLGAIVYSSEIVGQDSSITLEPKIDNGFYVFELIDRRGKVLVKKLIIEKTHE